MRFLEQFLGNHQQSGKELLFGCPFCKHHKKKLSVNFTSFQWKCWVCDKRGGTLFSLFWQLRHQQALAAYRKEFPKHYQPPQSEEDIGFSLSLPDEYEPLIHNTSLFGRQAKRYLQNRQVSQSQILRYRIGIATSGTYRNRIILPSFDEEGAVNFFTGRTLYDCPYKYLNPSTPKGYKNTIVMNELNIDWSSPVHLVEGFMDMLRIEDNVVPLFGSSLSESSQLFLNLVMNECKVYVCLDMDALKKQIGILNSLFSYGVECFGVDVAPYKDLGEMPANVFEARKKQAMKADQQSLFTRRLECYA